MDGYVFLLSRGWRWASGLLGVAERSRSPWAALPGSGSTASPHVPVTRGAPGPGLLFPAQAGGQPAQGGGRIELEDTAPGELGARGELGRGPRRPLARPPSPPRPCSRPHRRKPCVPEIRNGSINFFSKAGRLLQAPGPPSRPQPPPRAGKGQTGGGIDPRPQPGPRPRRGRADQLTTRRPGPRRAAGQWERAEPRLPGNAAGGGAGPARRGRRGGRDQSGARAHARPAAEREAAAGAQWPSIAAARGA